MNSCLPFFVFRIFKNTKPLHKTLIFDKEAVDFFSILNKIEFTAFSKGGEED